MVLVSKNMGGWVILPIWISNKSETFLKSMPTSSVAINVRFLGVIDPKPNLNGKNVFLKNKSSLGSY